MESLKRNKPFIRGFIYGQLRQPKWLDCNESLGNQGNNLGLKCQ